MSNFVINEVGKEIVAYTAENIPECILDRRIKGKIRYQGDERGGKYWLNEISIQD